MKLRLGNSKRKWLIGLAIIVFITIVIFVINSDSSTTPPYQTTNYWTQQLKALAMDGGSKGTTTPTDDNDGECEAGETGSDDCECDNTATTELESCEDESDCPLGSTDCDIGDGDETHNCGAGEIWDGDSCEEVIVNTNNLCSFDNNLCSPRDPVITYRSYNPSSGQTVDAWLSSDTGWQTGNIIGTLFGYYQIKWDAEELLTRRERYRHVGNEGLYTYQSSFSNCRLDMVTTSLTTGITRKTLATGRSGTYSGLMSMDPWLGGGQPIRVEVVCDNTVKRYYYSELEVTETQLGGQSPSPTAQIPYSLYLDHGKVAGEPATQCEVPFDQIVRNLNNGVVTNITEKSFRDWAKTDKFDDCDFKVDGTCARLNPSPYQSREKILRSGNVDDIKTAMAMGQCNSASRLESNQILRSFNKGKEILDNVDYLTKDKYPATIGFAISNLVYDPNDQFFVDNFVLNFVGYHIIVVLGVDVNNEVYTVKVLDSIGPRVHNVVCRENNVVYGGQVDELMICDFGIGQTALPVNIEYPALSDLQQRFSVTCPSSLNQDLCNRRSDLSGWLEVNYPNINNFSSMPSPTGTCYGWVDFVLKTTYLGNFAGECPHPISFSI